MKTAMESDVKSNNPLHLEKAQDYLINRSWRIPVVQNPSREQYESWEYRRKFKKNIYDFSEMLETKKDLFEKSNKELLEKQLNS